MYQFQEVLKSTDKCWKVLGCRQGASTLTSKRGGPCRVEQSNSVGKHSDDDGDQNDDDNDKGDDH